MNGCKGVILSCLVAAVFPLAGWAQEPAALPEPVEQAKIAPSILEPETESAPGPWMIGTRITSRFITKLRRPAAQAMARMSRKL